MTAGVIKLLLSNSALTALVSGRITPGFAPQGTPTPHLTLQRTGTQRLTTNTGPTNAPKGNLRITCYADTYAAAASVAAAVRLALNAVALGTTVTTSDATAYTFARFHLEDEGDLPTEERPGKGARLLGIALDYLVLWYEPT